MSIQCNQTISLGDRFVSLVSVLDYMDFEGPGPPMGRPAEPSGTNICSHSSHHLDRQNFTELSQRGVYANFDIIITK